MALRVKYGGTELSIRSADAGVSSCAVLDNDGNLCGELRATLSERTPVCALVLAEHLLQSMEARTAAEEAALSAVSRARALLDGSERAS